MEERKSDALRLKEARARALARKKERELAEQEAAEAALLPVLEEHSAGEEKTGEASLELPAAEKNESQAHSVTEQERETGPIAVIEYAQKESKADWREQELPGNLGEWEKLPEGYTSDEIAIPLLKEQTDFEREGLGEEPPTEETVPLPFTSEKKKKRRPIFGWGRLLMLLFSSLAAVFWVLFYKKESVAEWYARTVYTPLAGAFGSITKLLPVSLAEILILVFVALWLLLLIVFLVRMIGKKGRLRRLVSGVLSVIFTISMLLSCFVFLGGGNYQRISWAEANGVQVVPETKEKLAELYRYQVSLANELAKKQTRDEKLAVTADFEALSVSAARAVAKIAKEDKLLLPIEHQSAKPVFFSIGMSYARITGIFFPFTLEANVNVHTPEHTWGATICHEMMHQRGAMREEEANFLAVKACLLSKDPALQYSGCLLMMNYTENALYEADRDLCLEIAAGINDQVWADRRLQSDYWKQFETPVGEISNKVNDTYLKVNGQVDGVKSYGEFLDLLLADEDLAPLFFAE
ncbi:MAG: DUF3810 domain-containing protein [Oscillospiraceae bacterium]|nr:DUF3810 domain-containing protein [Oscillospiraceae bacterium]